MFKVNISILSRSSRYLEVELQHIEFFFKYVHTISVIYLIKKFITIYSSENNICRTNFHNTLFNRQLESIERVPPLKGNTHKHYKLILYFLFDARHDIFFAEWPHYGK